MFDEGSGPSSIEVASSPPFRPERLRSRRASLANVACLAGASLGIAAWGVASYYAGFEHGLVGLAVGALVGLSCMAAGGRGNRMATAAAVVALGAIVLGKFVAADCAIAAEYVAAAPAAPYEVWSDEQAASRVVTRRVVNRLDIFDFVFGALGVALAFGLVMRASRAELLRRRF